MPFADVAALAQPPHAVVVPVSTTTWKTIAVRPGDTLWHLAIAHRTTVRALVDKNRLPAGGNVIHPGQKLLVPGSPAAAPKPSTPAAKPAPKPATKPAPKPVASKPSGTTTPSVPSVPAGGLAHVVVRGDTMSGIAAKYKVSLTKLLAANKLKDAGLIYIGQRIVVPGVTSAPAPSTPAPSPTPPSGYTTPTKTQLAVAASKDKLAARDAPSRTETSDLIRATATRNGVDPKLALAIGWIESGWYQRAVSYTDAVGVMQLMPVAETWASQLAGRPLDRYDTQDNVTGGVLIIRALMATADTREQAIAGYYQGLYSVRTKGLYDDTKKYVANVLAVYDRM